MRLAWLLWILLLAPLAGAEGEWTRDVPNIFADTLFDSESERVTHHVARVVEDATGLPGRGARLYAVREYDHALP
jgi:hypothetical protein